MTAPGNARMRRGWCPGVRRPMETGDGLLARVHPPGGVLTASQARLIAGAAGTHGNGHLDVTSRGNLQIRGLGDGTYPALLERLHEAGLVEPEGDGPLRLTAVSPLAGIDPNDRIDALALAGAIEGRLDALGDLPAKVFVAVDGGGSMALDGIGADLQLLATGEDEIACGLASPAGPVWIGATSLAQAPAAAASILMGFAAMRRRGRTGARRIRDLAPGLSHEFATLVSLAPAASPPRRRAAIRAGALDLGDGHAVLLALPFGRCDAARLARAAAWSERFGNGEIRLSFTRGLLLPGVAKADGAGLMDEARRCGFIVDRDDARLNVVACPGKPACARAWTRAQEDALRIAEAAREVLAGGAKIHVSGCPKGCAQPGAADLTLVGRENGSYGVVLGGSSHDAPLAERSIEEIVTRLSGQKNPGDLLRAFEETAP
jgi:precorrin-3B synthase